MNDTEPQTPTKAVRNARVLNAVICGGEALAAELLAEARAKVKDDAEAADKVVAMWNRVTRRTMQAMVLDEKLDRAAAEDARRNPPPRPQVEPDPRVVQRRKDILRAFRMDPEGLDLDDDETLDGLLEEMAAGDELTDYDIDENITRICGALDWKRPRPVPPPQGEGEHEGVEGVRSGASTATRTDSAEHPSPPSGELPPKGEHRVPPSQHAPIVRSEHPPRDWRRELELRDEAVRRRCALERGEDPDSS